MSGNILAIDQGTTNTKALMVDPSGTVLARGSQPTSISYPQPGWVEQDALEVWRCTHEAINECLGALDEPDLVAVAVTNQRETALVWERETGKPVGPCVVWQCRRTASFCNELKAQGLEPLLQERTGLQVDPMFSASKIRWILDHTKDGRRRAEGGELCVGNIDSWILWNLTGGAVHATDMTNASRTQLLNLHELEWDEEALAIFGIPSAALPEIKPSSFVYGETVPIDSLPGGVPIASLIGDSHASLYGQGGFKPGSIKATYGTGSSLMTPTSTPLISKNGLSTTIAWARKKVTYALEGSAFVCGAAVQWLRDNLGLIQSAAETETIAQSVEDAGGAYFVPAFSGLFAPYWDMDARGVIVGLTRYVRREHLVHATLEAICYQTKDVLEAMQKDSGVESKTLKVDGGAVKNNYLMQLQADILGVEVVRPTVDETTALGAAYAAGLATGFWESLDDLRKNWGIDRVFEPHWDDARREEGYAGWKRAVERARGWVQ